MDRIFLFGGNIQQKLVSDVGIVTDEIQTFNQPGFTIKNWEFLTAAQQTTIVNEMAAIGCAAGN